MPQLTWIYRVSDPLILTAEESEQFEEHRRLAKQLWQKIRPESPRRHCVEAGDHYFMYIIEGDVCYITLCDSVYPKKLALAFLEEIKKEFDIQYGPEVKSARRPYAFIKFDTFIQKTKKMYLDTRSERNLDIVTKELSDVQRIMSQNIEEILNRGDKLNCILLFLLLVLILCFLFFFFFPPLTNTHAAVTSKSERLVFESESYKKKAKWLNDALFWRKWKPVIIVGVILLFCFYLYFFWF
ncbi:SNAP receptor [Balamuthia mandrillaris]